ncbi:hypothetical protein [Sphingomonas sp. PB4P5]|uniref:hypothetical protein n=1 Tax=Parasphingomonas puruogangriensis TaxID=3096155 RepID=UPI002FCA0FF6
MADAETWDCFIALFLAREARELSAAVPVAFAKLLGHDELCFDRHRIPTEIWQSASARILSFGAPEIAKLLRMIPDEDQFDRGDLGYAFLPMLGGRAGSRELLCTVRDDAAEDDEVRRKAAHLIAWQDEDPEWWLFWRRTA